MYGGIFCIQNGSKQVTNVAREAEAWYGTALGRNKLNEH